MKKILVMGLPGTGKTTLSTILAKILNGVHLNADEIRKEINKDLGFSVHDRIEHARRMGKLCDIITRSGNYAIADFVCPLPETREAFGIDTSYIVYMKRKPVRDFEDTSKMFIPPESDIEVTQDGSPLYWAELIKSRLI